ncbi:MAG: GTP pyrophosphokinase family protein [Lachnospiraceae bacterium]|nr:GTP pyrophosphokinase family protein [Lachnospiraceae bacterium]MCI7042203.1 GTP pyrophosphokinase family protein [Lachnospiraceae bacterium]MCI7190179.1 GTP pyrophosphokinase family protein [Lachnospiraceae bacterium]MDD7627367.1 GTP pyrophosphokinase family protein [Lachnospiraceae bacterium]MDY4118873.1 GTP pyrophosphokinase family protein [Lachnospiraceae bacterium]
MENELLSRENIPEEILEAFKENMKLSKKLMTYYSCALLEIETKFKVLNQQFSLEQEHNPIETIKTRLKSTESILEKLHRKNLPMDMAAVEENLYDVAGIRVICPFINDIYCLADCLLQQDDVTLIEKKDYIKNPKENGYRSLHLIVETPIFLQDEKRLMKVEVQLRTIAMDFWASLEHRMRYKKNLNPELSEMLSTELKDCAETSARLDIRMGRVKDVIEKNTAEE